MGYYSNDRNTYHWHQKPQNSYVNPFYGEISYSDPTKKQSQGGKYLTSAGSDDDSYLVDEYREQRKRKTRKKIRVPSMYILGIKMKVPSLQILLLLAAGILAVLLKYKILIWAIAALGVFTFMSMSGARYTHLIFPQRALCVIITAVLIVLAVFGNGTGTGFGPFGNKDITMNSNMGNDPPVVPPEPPAVATEPTTIPTEPPTIATTAPPPPPETKPLRLSHDGINLDMQLYYNENGGNYYHTTDMCSAVGADYLPLTGKLIYEELSVGKFKSLKRCTTCSAPVRPHTH